MKHLIALALITLSSSVALAEGQTQKLNCHFTEPFFSLEVDLQTKTVTKIEPDWKGDSWNTVRTVIAENISLESNFSDPLLPTYKVLKANGETLADLKLNMQGSDGMSDITFPFDIQFESMWGGCESDLIKAVNPNE